MFSCLRFNNTLHFLLYFLLASCFFVANSLMGQSSNLLWLDGDRLAYGTFAMKEQSNAVNRIPDFSHAGYMGGGVALPNLPTIITLSPSGGDDTALIQSAIDQVEAMDPDLNGFRGAVLLKAGTYQVDGQLFIEESGVVLRGEGQGQDGTILLANMRVKENFLHIRGSGSGIDRLSSTEQRITTPYVALGSYSFEIEDASGYTIGDTIVVLRTPNQFWIDDLAMGQFGWTSGSYTINHERIITAINGNTLSVNVPIIDVIEDQYGGGRVYKASIQGRIQHCGVENLRIRSYFNPEDVQDEDHAWIGVVLTRTTNSWVRNVTGEYLGYGTVSIVGESNFNTIQECASIEHKSPVSGGRRYSFNIGDGMGNLFQRNYTRNGRHDYVTGSRVTGPNVFLDCYSDHMFSDTGPHHRWATGLLFDNIRAGEVRVRNRGSSGSGHGWAGNTTMFWNLHSVVGDIWVDSPKGGMNWGIGCEGRTQTGSGFWDQWGTPVLPRSLYLQQLKDRLGEEAVKNITIPTQLEGDIYQLLGDWAGDGDFGEVSKTKRIYPIEDSYVRGGEHADTNFGTSDNLDIKNNGEGHVNDRKAYLKFDLHAISDSIKRAKLRIRVDNDAPRDAVDAFHHVLDDAWMEDGITYNLQPELGERLTSFTVPPNGAWVEVDLTDIVLQEWKGDGILSLRITEETGGSLHGLGSIENRNHGGDPHLVYTIADPPCDNSVTERSETICYGESYNGYTDAGIYADTLVNNLGCDSIILLDLDVILPDTINQGPLSLCSGEAIVIDGTTIEADTSGRYSIEVAGSSGCIEQVHILDVEVLQTKVIQEFFEVCGGEALVYEGRTYDIEESGTYTFEWFGEEGCLDTLLTLEIELITPLEESFIIDVCEGERVTYYDVEFFFDSSGVYTYAIEGPSGCNEVILELTVNYFSLNQTHPWFLFQYPLSRELISCPLPPFKANRKFREIASPFCYPDCTFLMGKLTFRMPYIICYFQDGLAVSYSCLSEDEIGWT